MRGLVVAMVLAVACASPALADSLTDGPPLRLPTTPVPPTGLGSDIFVVLVSDTTFGPDMEDANMAARFYCSSRGKLATFVGKEHPPEMRTQMFQEWSVLTYRCVEAVTNTVPPPITPAPQGQ
jgi:hypothetical protein